MDSWSGNIRRAIRITASRNTMLCLVTDVMHECSSCLGSHIPHCLDLSVGNYTYKLKHRQFQPSSPCHSDSVESVSTAVLWIAFYYLGNAVALGWLYTTIFYLLRPMSLSKVSSEGGFK